MAVEWILPESVRKQCVLVVDDSEVQRAFTVETLRELGFAHIAEARDGYVALARLHAGDPQPTVMIVDLEMPMMDGVELIQHVSRTKLRPALIIASGRETVLIDAVARMSEAMALPLLGALHKPLSRESLGALLANLDKITLASQAEQGKAPARIEAADLSLALAAGFIKAYFQPKVDLATGELRGVEALARWIEPGKPTIPPGLFVDVAEQSGQMRALTLCMLQHGIAVLRRWAQQRLPWTMAINLSPAVLSDMLLADTIIRMVEAAQIDASRIVFEVTESTVTDVVATGALLRLRLRGFGLSIDDYGTGFSSMQQLSRLPFSELKIDRSLVSGANVRDNLRTILASAVDMGRRLGLATVAEGIETWDEWHMLSEIGCDAAQGYLIGKPMPAEELPDSLADFARRLKQETPG